MVTIINILILSLKGRSIYEYSLSLVYYRNQGGTRLKDKKGRD